MITSHLEKKLKTYKTVNSYFQLQEQEISIHQNLIEIKNGLYKYIYNSRLLNLPSVLSSETTILLTQLIHFEKEVRDLQDELNAEIQLQVDKFEQLLIQVLIPAALLLFLIFFIIIYAFLKQTIFEYRMLGLFRFLKKSVLEQQIALLSSTLHRLRVDQKQMVDELNFDIAEASDSLERQIMQQDQLQKSLNVTKHANAIKYPRFSLLGVQMYAWLLIILSSILILTIYQLNRVISFLGKFNRQASVYEKFCNSQHYAATMLYYKEYLYIYYDLIIYLRLVHPRQAVVDNFLSYYSDLSLFVSKYMVDDYSDLDAPDFLRLYGLAQHSNMCRQILNLTLQETGWCESMLGGALKLGLPQTISAIMHDLKNEFDLTNFNITKRTEKASTVDNYFGI